MGALGPQRDPQVQEGASVPRCALWEVGGDVLPLRLRSAFPCGCRTPVAGETPGVGG